MSGFELITITFSFIVGLGVAQLLRSLSEVIRYRDRVRMHWMPLVAATMILYFQVQFWFGLAVVNANLEVWSWPIYALFLGVAVLVFLAGATVLPYGQEMERGDLLEDYISRGRISMVFLGLYLLGWIGIGVAFWRPEFWLLVLINGLAAGLCFLTSRARRGLTLLHGLLIAVTLFGSLSVWTTPNLEMPPMGALFTGFDE